MHAAISFVLSRKPQEEFDSYRDMLPGEGRDGRCGWPDDRFGVSWQMVPANIWESTGRAPKRVMETLLAMHDERGASRGRRGVEHGLTP